MKNYVNMDGRRFHTLMQYRSGIMSTHRILESLLFLLIFGLCMVVRIVMDRAVQTVPMRLWPRFTELLSVK